MRTIITLLALILLINFSFQNHAKAAAIETTSLDDFKIFSYTNAINLLGICLSTALNADDFDARISSIGCMDCPDISPSIAAQYLCSGNDVNFAIVESRVFPTGNNIGTYSYFLDAGHTIPYSTPINQGCSYEQIDIFGRLQCSDPGSVGTVDEFDDFSFGVIVNPEQPTIQINSLTYSSNEPIFIDLISAGGDICDWSTVVSFTNFSCDVVVENIQTTISAIYIDGVMASQDSGCYQDILIDENVSICPDVSTWIITETSGNCDIGPSVTITTEDGDVCYSQTGSIPRVVCPDEVGYESIDYLYHPGLPECIGSIIGTVEAFCVGCCPDNGTPALKKKED